jgi:hypothetical protein
LKNRWRNFVHDHLQHRRHWLRHWCALVGHDRYDAHALSWCERCGAILRRRAQAHVYAFDDVFPLEELCESPTPQRMSN